MNESRKRLWDNAIEKIDDKYINETAETLKKHSGKEIQLTEIIVEKPAEDKNEAFRRALKITFSVAAAFTVVIGGGVALRTLDLRENRPLSSDTTTCAPEITTDPTLVTTAVDSSANATETTPSFIQMKGEVVDSVWVFDSAQYELQLTEKPDGTLTVYGVRSNNVLFEYDTGLDSVTIGETSSAIGVYRYSSGNIVKITTPMQKENGGIEYQIRLYQAYGDGITPLKQEYDAFDENTPTYHTDSFIITSDKPYINADTQNNTFRVQTADHEMTSYTIDFRSNTVKQEQLFAMDGEMSRVICVINTDYEFEYDPNVFENVLYGKWESVYNGDPDGLYFSYYGSSESGATYEAEDGWYIYNVFGGEVELWYIPKSDPTHLYVYGGGIADPENCSAKNEYLAIYERITKAEYIADEEFELAQGALSPIGVAKLEKLTGFDIYSIPYEVTDFNGNQWKLAETYGDYLDLYYAYDEADLCLISHDENKIKFSRRYTPADTVVENYADDDDSTNIPLAYLTFTVESVNGNWDIMTIEEFDPAINSFDEVPSEYAAEIDAETASINNMLAAGGMPLSSSAISVEFHRTKDGHYYAHRRSGNSMALDLTYNEYYYYNGFEYIPITRTEGFYPQSALFDDKFYYLTRIPVSEDGSEYKTRLDICDYNNGNPRENYMILDAYDYSQEVSVEKIGLFNIITVTLNHHDNYYFIQQNDCFGSTPVPVRVVNADDKKGFTVLTEEGEELHYTAESDSLADVIDELTYFSQTAWIPLQVSTPPLDMSDAYVDTDNPAVTYYCMCEYEVLEDYLSQFLTIDAVASVLPYQGGKFVQVNGKIYTYPSEGRGTDMNIAEIKHEIISENDTDAVVRYYVYAHDGSLYEQYTINAVKTEDGWRLDSFYSPY
ncbi:MAG: hypothetical protein IJ385_00670 [Ruminiclostridium sp.]|nr:hypothetical protein [Ruminiclostridium sp.]